MRLIFGSIDCVKQNTFSNVGEPHLISWRLEYNKNGRLSHKDKGTRAWRLDLVFSYLWTWTEALTIPESCWFTDWNFHHQLSWFSGLQTQTGTMLLAIHCLQLADWWSVGSVSCRTLNNTPWLSWLTWQNVIGSQGFTGASLGPSMASIKLD